MSRNESYLLKIKSKPYNRKVKKKDPVMEELIEIGRRAEKKAMLARINTNSHREKLHKAKLK